MSRANDLVQLHNVLAKHLCRITGLDVGASFNRLVDAAAPQSATVRRNRLQLKAFGRLRNAIVHDEGYPPEVIAEPSAAALLKFEAIVKEIISPASLIPKFQSEVHCFLVDDPLPEALAYMRENDYSQVAVRQDGALKLLTTEGVARWFADRSTVETDRVSLTSVGDALRFDLPDGFLILRADQTIDDAREAFATEIDRGQARLYALLITQTGAATEEPIGIITPWDLLRIRDA